MKAPVLDLVLDLVSIPALSACLAIALSVAAPAAFGNVFDRDARVAVTGDAWNGAPRRWAGRLRLPDGWWCSATLIHRDLILTNAHCLMDPERRGALLKGAYEFHLGYERGAARAVSATTYAWWGTRDTQANPGADWAIMRLREPLGDRFGWMGVSAADPARFLDDGSVAMTSYSDAFLGGEVASFEQGCSLTSLWKQGTFTHDCSQSSGSSGSAMVRRMRGSDGKERFYVVAVNSSGIYVGNAEMRIPRPYSDQAANIAVPASRFIGKLKEIIASSKKEGPG